MTFDFLRSTVTPSFSLVEVIINILIAFALGTAVAVVYRRTHKGLSYSQGFVMSIVMLSMITSIVMMVIGNNLATAFTLVGALSIIRFRTAVKDPRDIAYVFLALVIGMACGTNNYYIAFVGAVLVSFIVILLTKINFGSITKHEYILRFFCRGDEVTSDQYKEVFNQYLRSTLLLNLNSIEEGKLLEMSYNIKFKDNTKLTEFIKQLSAIEGVENVGIVSAKNDVDY